jgi:hypothetical protein
MSHLLNPGIAEDFASKYKNCNDLSPVKHIREIIAHIEGGKSAGIRRLCRSR